jgi:preprotein translocase subunit SecD
VINVPGESNDTIRKVGTPAQLRFRTVLARTVNVPDAEPSPTATPSPGASATPTPTASASTKAAPTTQPAASAAPTSPAATPSPTRSAIDPAKERAAVLKQLGPAALVAESITDPAAAQEPATMVALAPFGRLTPEQVRWLPAQMQFVVPQITCEKLNSRPAGSIDAVDEQVVACEESGDTKYLLDKAKVLGTDISRADAALDSQTAGQWVVNLQFSGDGQKKWTALTRDAFTNANTTCPATSPAGAQTNAQGDEGHCLVAVVLDNEVVSAPQIQGVLTTDSQISGSFTRASAQLLANQLRYGALPLTFEPGESNLISATLGTDYLKAGLLAAGIGMALVIIYAFFYYRLLGSVIFGSLVLSALLTFGMLVLLGRQIGFTLTLAGIAGFIVSLGVAADSFVIYFERLKDEIRDGRSPKSAIPRAWARAKRTIITANAVTIMAAVVLYLVGTGSVKGFAFALGLATSLDLLIVFLFRHPIMTLLARTPAFLSPRVSGLGRVLQNARPDVAASGSTGRKGA